MFAKVDMSCFSNWGGGGRMIYAFIYLQKKDMLLKLYHVLRISLLKLFKWLASS